VKKRILMILSCGVALTLLLPAMALATSAGTEVVAGVVTSSVNGNIVVGAQVIVVCNGNTRKTTTSSTGAYSVQYTTAQCPNKALADVTAIHEGQSGSNSGEVNDGDLALKDKPNVTVVPVFGLVTGGVATVLGGLGYLTIRRS
jgi:hypothetical protein